MVALDFNVNGTTQFTCDILPVGSLVPTITPIEILTVDNTGVTISGDLKVTGNMTEVNTENITVEDPLVKIANGNITNTLNAGIYMTYNNGVQKYAGLVRNSVDQIWRLLNNDTVEPTVNGAASTSLGNFKCAQVNTQFINSNDSGSDMVISSGSNAFELRSNNTTSFTTGDVIVNNIVQDTKLSCVGSYTAEYAITTPTQVLLNDTYLSALAGVNSSGVNVGFNAPTNTFTALYDGLYRIHYSVSLRNIDNDNTSVIVEMRRNGGLIPGSRSRVLRQRNRIAPMANTFVISLIANDTVRMAFVSEEDNGGVGNENVDIFNVSVHLERIHLNS
jgi:hypothetical protein